ncbi:MAG: hypothetical protein GY953_21125, partial [bacterium]|nr:hypothetical protein [bacterium]
MGLASRCWLRHKSPHECGLGRHECPRHVGVSLLLLLCSCGAPDATVYVAASGNDGGLGSREQPFATLARAADAVKERGAVRVVVSGGTYYLNETLVLGPEHSGTEAAPVVFEAAPGELPRISGGAAIAGTWKPGEGGVFVCELDRKD